jgi:hypothetical protein
MKNNYSNACGCEASMDGEQIKGYGQDVLDTVQSGAMDIFDVVKSTGGFVVEEAKEGYEKVKEQGEKLDDKERIIKSIPNSYLVFGAIGLLIYSMVK